MMNNEKCFADMGDRCTALEVKKCYPKCTFYKTKRQVERERERADARLEELGVSEYYQAKYGK